MPAAFEKYWQSWQHHHPGWNFLTWTDENLPALADAGQYARCPNPAMKSDFVRYEVVRLMGGVYIDTDFECLRPIDDLLDDVEFVTGWESNGRFLAGGLFASTREHSLTSDLSCNIGENARRVNDRSAARLGFYYAPHGRFYPAADFPAAFLQSAQTGPLYFTNQVFEWLVRCGYYDVERRRVADAAECRVRLCDERTFYPWKPWKKFVEFDNVVTRAVHHYDGSWLPAGRSGSAPRAPMRGR